MKSSHGPCARALNQTPTSGTARHRKWCRSCSLIHFTSHHHKNMNMKSTTTDTTSTAGHFDPRQLWASTASTKICQSEAPKLLKRSSLDHSKGIIVHFTSLQFQWPLVCIMVLVLAREKAAYVHSCTHKQPAKSCYNWQAHQHLLPSDGLQTCCNSQTLGFTYQQGIL